MCHFVCVAVKEEFREQSGPTSDQRRQHRRQLQQLWPRQTVSGGLAAAGEEAVSVYVSPAGRGVIEVTGSVKEDGVERALSGAGARVTGGAGARDTARALLRVSGGAGTWGCCCGGPRGNGTRGCCVT